jgi:hypothetical protein
MAPRGATRGLINCKGRTFSRSDHLPAQLLPESASHASGTLREAMASEAKEAIYHQRVVMRS